MCEDLMKDDNLIFILPEQDKPIKIRFIDNNEHIQFCKDCFYYSKYKANEKVDFCLNCGSRKIQ